MEKEEKILSLYADSITGLQDLTAGKKPAFHFYFVAKRLRYLLETDDGKYIDAAYINRRKLANSFIRTFGKLFLGSKQIIENRDFLLDPDSTEIKPDPGIILPDKPVIWAANHGFKDDVLATIAASKRQAMVFFGSVPLVYNTFDGIALWANGMILSNRKIKESRQSTVPKSVKTLNLGTDLIIFPEGVWNKSPNELLLDFWPGIYKVACETGSPIVPVVHYISEANKRERSNPIHTVVDDPIDICHMSEHAALEYLREIMSTWLYRMMEAYGKSTRAQVVCNQSSKEYWEQGLIQRAATVSRLDMEIETTSDYRSKKKIRPCDVWFEMAKSDSIKKANADHVAYAYHKVIEEMQNDFQHRF